MRINHNLASLNTYRQLSTNTANTSKSLEKLSSGLRINRAGDDAAGLAISEKMRGQIRGLDQATRNAQDGISMIQTAEGSLNETQSILQRMKELATQAANSTNVDQDRTEIQKEINQLTSEINRIGNTTEFNTQKLLNGGSGVTSQIRYSILKAAIPAVGSATGELENITKVRGSVAQSSTTVAATVSTASRKGESLVVGEFAQPVEVTGSVKGGTGAIYGFNVDAKSTKAGGAIGTPTFDVVDNSISTGTGAASETSTFRIGGAGAATRTQVTAGANAVAGRNTYQFTNPFAAGDTLTIDGTVFTAVASGAVAGSNNFNIGANVTDTADNLVTAMNGNVAFSAKYTASAAVGTLTLTGTVSAAGIATANAGAATIGATTAIATGAVTHAQATLGAAGTAGVDTYQIDTAFVAGDTITIDGTTFTAVASGAVAANSEFDVGDVATTRTNLLAAMTATAGFAADYTATATGATTDSITLTSVATAPGTNAGAATLAHVASGAANATTVVATSANAVAGVDTFQLTTNFGEGQSITIDGRTFTAVAKNAVAANGEFVIGTGGANAAADITTTRNNLLAAMNATVGFADATGDYTEASVGTDTIRLTANNAAAGSNAGAHTINGAAVASQFAFDITNNFSAGDTIEIGDLTITAVAADAVAGVNEFKVNLDKDITAGNIRTLLNGKTINGNVYTSGNTDPSWGANPHLITLTNQAAEVDNTLSAAGSVDVTQNAGTQGQYRFEIKNNLVDGQKIEIGGKTFTAKSVVADATKEFAIGTTTEDTSGNLMTLLADAANGLGGKYTVANGTGVYKDTIILTEITASGTDLQTPIVSTVSEQAGEYSFDLSKNFSVGDKINIKGVTLKAVAAGAVDGDGTFNIGVNADAALALADTVSNLKDAIEGDNTLKDIYTVGAPTAGVAGAGTKLTLTEKVTSGKDLTVSDINVQKTLATQGAYDIQIKTNITAGEKVTIAGREFTALASTATTVADNQFKIGATAADTAANLVTQLNKDTTLKGVYSSITSTTDTIHLGEKAGNEQAAIPTVSIDKATDVVGKYSIKFAAGIAVGDKITIAGTEFTAGSGVGATDFAVAGTTKGTIDNLIAKINAAGSPLKTSYSATLNTNNANPLSPVYSIDLTEVAVTGDDTKVTGATATKVVQATGTLGQDTFEIKTNLTAGDKLNIGNLSLLAGTDFVIGADTTATATNVAAAVTAKATATTGYNASSAGNKILIEEVKASGANLSSSNTNVTANAESGKFEFAMNALNAGSKIKIDGTELTSTKGGSEIDTAAELKELIDNNTTLSAKYSVAVTGANVTLTQKAGQESATNPTLSFSTTAGSGFISNMQIGANSGQSMSVEIKDMRSLALNVSSATATTGETVEVEGKQYAVAWTAATTVTNGSDSIATEFALDVSSHDNATAAIKVLDTAINSVSSERSRLGAYQNRMEHTINNLGTSSENMTAAESRIRDVDMAKEMMEFTKNNILTQAAQAMLAQANQQPQGVLQLLR